MKPPPILPAHNKDTALSYKQPRAIISDKELVVTDLLHGHFGLKRVQFTDPLCWLYS